MSILVTSHLRQRNFLNAGTITSSEGLVAEIAFSVGSSTITVYAIRRCQILNFDTDLTKILANDIFFV